MMEIKIKLYDAKEELPKRSGEYLCFVGGDHEFSVGYRTVYSGADVFGLYHSIKAVQTITEEFHDELLWYFTEHLPSIN